MMAESKGDTESEIERDMQAANDALTAQYTEDEYNFELLEYGDAPTIIVDIDGTVSHNNGHRGWYEYEKVGLDEPKKDVIGVVIALSLWYGSVHFVSGREDRCREATSDWLAKEFGFGTHNPFKTRSDVTNTQLLLPRKSQNIGYQLLMRGEKDYRDDSIVKYELLRDWIAPAHYPVCVLDDRDRVVRMWRKLGLTCLQVDYGDF